MKNGVINEYASSLNLYDFETICGTIEEKTYPSEYEIPRENTGTLKDQGRVGACVACACTQVSEAIERINKIVEGLKTKGYSEEQINNMTDDLLEELLKDISTNNLEMSEGYFYGTHRHEKSTSSGMLMSQALNGWKNTGSVPKSYYDILLEMPEQKESLSKYPELNEIANKFIIGGYVKISNANKEKRDLAIKQALTQYPRIKQLPLVAVSRSYFGESHCILVTGWNDETDCYKIKNSWGDDYGDDGYKEIPKDKINEFYAIVPNEIVLPFIDVNESDWFFTNVKHMYFNGLVKGKTATTFEPNAGLTRAEACALFDRYTEMVNERFDILNKVISEKLELMK